MTKKPAPPSDEPASNPEKVERGERELARLQNLAALAQVAAGITHEVRNAMTGVLGFAQLGQKKTADPAASMEVFRVMERESVRCLELLSSFLGFARSPGASFEPLDVRDVVKATARVVRPQLELDRTMLAVLLEDHVPAVSGNGARLQQVLLNLVLNAAQAMPDGGRVELRATRGGDGSALLQVADTGPGIPESLRHSIFEPFFSTKADGQSTGLGLFVSRGIVEDHGGEMTFDSELGKGTVFTVRLPALAEIEASR